MLVTMLLGDDRPPFRRLWEGELPVVPDAGEPLAFNGRVYRVMERSWRFGTPSGSPQLGLAPMNGGAPVEIAVGLMLTQIAGPPHVALVAD